ncbi:MAG: hypothetical protein GWP08_19050 [Nitrospiraceae bacterium]|nr:hypothetical protein [Nitrospiraceae bacterium]
MSYSIEDLAAVSGLSRELVEKKLAVLRGNRLIYPDGTINRFVTQYLKTKTLSLFKAKSASRPSSKRLAKDGKTDKIFSMSDEAQQPFETRSRKTSFIHKMGRPAAGVVCPPYFVLSHGNGCPYRCDYCCLQLPLGNVSGPVVFEHRQRLVRETQKFLERGQPWLLSAGESSDSLALDDLTRLSEDLAPLFSRQDDGLLFPREKKHKLLLVTKSVNVERLLSIREHANVVVSFSLNAPEVTERYEHGAPHPYERLRAAGQCQRAGYAVRIRIDPIIPEEGWELWYRPLLERIASEMKTKGLRFTLGTIRHNAGLRECARRRGRNGTVFDLATSREGADGRYRLPVELRREVYRWFKERLPEDASVALCKETEELWRDLDLDPANPKCNCAL